MLDINRLSSNVLLIKSGWSPEYRVDIEKAYNGIEKVYGQRNIKNICAHRYQLIKFFPVQEMLLRL